MTKRLLLLLAAALLTAGCVRERVERPGGLVFTLTVPKTFSVPNYTVVSTTSPAAAGPSEIEVEDEEEGADDEGSEIFVSTDTKEAPPPPVNLGGNGTITITRQDTGERLRVTYRTPEGYDQDALAKVNHIMRCSYDGSETQMAVKLVELLDAMEDHFGKKGITLLSGYRTREYNEIVPGSAKRSLHVLGWAADIKIPGYSSTKIKNFGLNMGVGGVGYYPNKGFTHLDVGNPRYWVVKRAPRRRRRPSRRIKYQTGVRTAAKKKSSKAAASRTPSKSKPAAKSASKPSRTSSAKKKNGRA